MTDGGDVIYGGRSVMGNTELRIKLGVGVFAHLGSPDEYSSGWWVMVNSSGDGQFKLACCISNFCTYMVGRF